MCYITGSEQYKWSSVDDNVMMQLLTVRHHITADCKKIKYSELALDEQVI